MNVKNEINEPTLKLNHGSKFGLMSLLHLEIVKWNLTFLTNMLTYTLWIIGVD